MASEYVEGLEQIGEGTFSLAYQNKKKCIIASVDPIKKHMADGKLPDHPMFPKVTHIGSDGELEYYSMPLYEVLSHVNPEEELNKRQFRFYKAIVSAFDWVVEEPWEALAKIDAMPKEFDREKKVLMEAIHSFDEYGDDAVAVEAPRFNLAVHNKKLILLDIFYPNCNGALETVDLYNLGLTI